MGPAPRHTHLSPSLDTMVPEATEHAGKLVGLMIVAGFTVAFVLSHL